MYGDNPRSTASIAGHPIHPMLIPFPITCLVGALVTDLLYLNTDDRGFAVASHWLIGFGIGTALLAATFGLRRVVAGSRSARRALAVVVLVTGLGTLGFRGGWFFPEAGGSDVPPCHAQP